MDMTSEHLVLSHFWIEQLRRPPGVGTQQPANSVSALDRPRSLFLRFRAPS